MKKYLIGIAAIGALIATPAGAADLYRPRPPVYTKAPAYVAPSCTWCGWYIGVNAGWVGSANDTITNTGTDTDGGGLGTVLAAGALPSSVSLSDDGFLGGGQIGYNWQSGAAVFGLEADFDGASAKSSTTVVWPGGLGFVPFSTTYNRELDWLGTVRGRIGVAAGSSFLLYGTGGLAVGRTKIGNQFICAACGPPASTEASTSNTSTNTSAGWTVGAGAEWMFAPHWSLKAEYLFVDLGSHSSTITYTYGTDTSTLTSSVKDTYNIARAGINYHF
jgi:outer membrane immunogenic protein